MTNSTKGLERRGRGYRERVGDYCLDYDPWIPRVPCWFWMVRRDGRSAVFASGRVPRLRDARILAATAVALQEERT